MTFSVITTDESTSTPIEIASPASDMMLVWTSATPICRRQSSNKNAASTASGSVSVMTNEVRKWRKTTSTQTVAMSIASKSVSVTVPMAPSISGVRS